MAQAIPKAKMALLNQENGEDPDHIVEEKILLAEYALDFAIQAADRALLFSMEAIDAQLTQQKAKRRSLWK